MLQVLVGGHEGAGAVVLVDFAIAENIRNIQNFFDEPNASFVVAREVVAVGEMEGVDVVEGGGETAVDNLQRLDISGRADRPAALAAREEFLLGHFLGFRMVRDEHDFHLFILPS